MNCHQCYWLTFELYTNLCTLPGKKFNVSYYVINQAQETDDLLLNEMPAFIPTSLWPSNSRDLNPLDCSIWQVMQDRVHRTKIDNVDQLKQRTLRVWSEMEQTVIDKAVDQWRKTANVCLSSRQLLWTFNVILFWPRSLVLATFSPFVDKNNRHFIG